MQEEISFGQWLRKQRRTLDLTRQAFADQVGCAEVTLRRIEAGSLKPSRQLASILLEKIGISETERPQWISFARGLAGFPSQSPTALNKPKSNLPAQLTTFIGREKEQADVVGLIAKHRLVTLTGPGGVGKTRLSIKVGAQSLSSYPDGVWLVELAPILEPLLVPRTTAIAIGLRDEPQRPVIDMLSDDLREKDMLIILDNCEHLLDACASLVGALLKHCPRLKILATSREALGILGESLYPVPSLELPDFQHLLENFRRYESVRLFEERAQLIRMNFSLTLENTPAVAKICTHLDGIPLAIELAAARVGTFSAEQIAVRLEESFSLLTTGNRTALPRHKTLQATIEWSYDLLSSEEQTLFRRLSVFVNSWTLEAAESICSDVNVKSKVIIALLTQLINKSLVIKDEMEDETRYRMLETIRQFACEKLMESEEDQVSIKAHAEYFLNFVEEVEPQLTGAEQIIWINHLEVEYDNLRAALDWFIRTRHGNSALRLASALGRFWHIRGLFREGREFLKHAIQIGIDSDKNLQAKALCWDGILAYTQGDYEIAQSTLNHSLAISYVLEDKRGMADALYFIGVINRIQEDHTEAQESFEESLKLRYGLNDMHGVANALINLGSLFQSRGDNARALEMFQESLEIFHELAYKRGIAYSLLNLGNVTYVQKEMKRSREFYKESLALSYELGDRWSAAYALTGLANILGSERQYMLCAQMQAVVTDLLDQLSTEFEPFEQKEFNRTAVTLKATLGDERYCQWFEEGKSLSLEKAIELAIQND
jgi:predicted ATPase/DNA-binding XRE family transcriptional regulator/Tfp pilus assembly protein PilF